jgi:hypothetical protein
MKRLCFIILFGLMLVSGVNTINAQSGGTYDLTWNSVDSGGGPVSGGTYTLDSTIGQADAGSLSGGSYTLNGGYWFAATSVPLDQLVYLPLVLK